MSKINSKELEKGRLLLTGLKNNIKLVENKGLDNVFINQLESEINMTSAYNEECEKLKAEMKVKIRQMNLKMNELKNVIKTAKKIIKQDFDKSQWSRFGLSDLR
jgi:hypothetical protein